MDQAAFFVYNNFIQINYYEAVFSGQQAIPTDHSSGDRSIYL